MTSRRSTSVSRPLVAAALFAALATLPEAHAQAGRQVGVAAAVTGQVQLAAVGAAARSGVRSGEAIRLGDQIATGPDSKLQIMLADETVFTIGPNAAITIDEFVFDAPSGRGKLTADIARGAFRFVTGRIAANNPQDMKVTMPVGTMGIRGTVVAGQVGSDRATIVLLGPGDQNNANERMGRVLVSGTDASQGAVELRRPGFATEIVRGGAPSSPFRLGAAPLEDILRSLSNDRGRGARAGSTGDSAEELAEIETAAGGDGLTGGSGQGLADGLRGIRSFSDVIAMLDRPFPTGPASDAPAALVLRVPDSLVRTAELRSFTGSTVFPVSVFGLSGGPLPGSFSVTATFDHGAGRVDGTLLVSYGSTSESFRLSVLFPGGGISAARSLSSDVNRSFDASIAPGITVFAFTSDRSDRLIEYRYMLMRSDQIPGSAARPDQLLNGLTYQTAADRSVSRTTAVGVGIAQTSGEPVQLSGAARDTAIKALELDVRR
jgi:hypothetical protein